MYRRPLHPSSCMTRLTAGLLISMAAPARPGPPLERAPRRRTQRWDHRWLEGGPVVGSPLTPPRSGRCLATACGPACSQRPRPSPADSRQQPDFQARAISIKGSARPATRAAACSSPASSNWPPTPARPHCSSMVVETGTGVSTGKRRTSETEKTNRPQTVRRPDRRAAARPSSRQVARQACYCPATKPPPRKSTARFVGIGPLS